MKRLILTISTGLTASFGAITGLAQTPTQIYTGITNFIYVGKPGMNASTATTAIHSTPNPMTPGGGFNAVGTPLNVPNHVNGVGLNQLDGYLYGIEFLASGPYSSNAKFFRVGGNGVTQQLGVLTGPTSTDAGTSVQISYINTTAGFVDGNGDYWFTAYTMQNANIPLVSQFRFFLGKVANVQNRAPGTANITPTYYRIDISNPRLQTGFQNFLNQVVAYALAGQPISNADGGAEDLAIDPISAAFYTYVSFPNSGSISASLYHFPVRLNTGVSPWRLEPVGTTNNTVPNREIVGIYFDLIGNMFGLWSNGLYSPINTTTGALTNLQMSALPKTMPDSNLRGDLASNIACAVALNVKFIAVGGRVEGGNTAIINWQTGDDKTIAKYIVERSADGRAYEAVAEVPATNAGSYGASDAMPGSAVYRVKAVSRTGESGYSPIVRLAATSVAAGPTTAYPTVLTGETIQVSTSHSSAIVQLLDLNGRILRTETIGAGTEAVSLPSLASGIYILTVRDANSGEMLLNQRVTKQ